MDAGMCGAQEIEISVSVQDDDDGTKRVHQQLQRETFVGLIQNQKHWLLQLETPAFDGDTVCPLLFSLNAHLPYWTKSPEVLPFEQSDHLQRF